MTELNTPEIVTREVIVARFTQKCYDFLNTSASLADVFKVSLMAPEVINPLLKYSDGDAVVQKAIDGLTARSWHTIEDAEELLKNLKIFSDYDLKMIISGFTNGDLVLTFKRIFDEYNYCYKLSSANKPNEDSVQREIIVARLVQRFYHILETGHSFSTMFEIAFSAPEVLEPILAYNGVNNKVKNLIDGLHSEEPISLRIRELMRDLDLFSEYDIALLIVGLETGSLINACKGIFEQYNFCYDLS